MTQGLKKIESSLGFKLFHRHHNDLSPTDEGIIFLSRTRRAIQFLLEARALLGPAYRNNKKFLRLLTTGQLSAVAAVADKKSYTIAARHLGLSQPTVHRAVKDVERLIQAPLFSKSETGVDVSLRAKRFAQKINLFFNEINQGIEDIKHYEGQPCGVLRIGSLPLSRATVVPRTVVVLTQKFPRTEISIIEGPYEEQLNSLLHGRLDLIIGALRPTNTDSGILQEPLFKDELSIVMKRGHALDSPEPISANDLRGFSWVAPRKDTPGRLVFADFFKRHGLREPDEIVESSSLVATRGLLLESDRLALLSRRQVEIEIHHKILSLKPQKLAGTQRDIGITYRKNWKPTVAQRTFIEILKAHFHDYGGQ